MFFALSKTLGVMLLPSNFLIGLGLVGRHIAKQLPDFDSRNYGFARLSDLVEASGIADIEWVGDKQKVVMVRLKPTL